jgi:hypothetical protein
MFALTPSCMWSQRKLAYLHQIPERVNVTAALGGGRREGEADLIQILLLSGKLCTPEEEEHSEVEGAGYSDVTQCFRKVPQCEGVNSEGLKDRARGAHQL